MSLSISKLMGNLMNAQVSGVAQPTPEGEIYNPDVPNAMAPTILNKKIIQDKFYSNMKLPSQPRNGTGYYFGRDNGRLTNMDPRQDAFLMEGSIDPNKIRRQTDPDSALPNGFEYGSLLSKYKLPEGSLKATNNLSLVQRSTMSYENYKNRFEPADNRIMNILKKSQTPLKTPQVPKLPLQKAQVF